MSDVSKYNPISCNFYDELEARATLRRPCTIQYREGGHAHTLTGAVVADLYVRDGVEYMQLESGRTIRLDRLIAVDDKELKDYC